MVANIDCTVVAKIDGKDYRCMSSPGFRKCFWIPRNLTSLLCTMVNMKLKEMLLDPEEPYVVAVNNGEHEISGNEKMKVTLDFVSRLQEMLLDPEEPYVVAVNNGDHETSGNDS